MIRYDLVCDAGHAFDAWFGDSASFERQAKEGFLSCPTCASTSISKAIMAPNVARARSAAEEVGDAGAAAARAAMRELRSKLTEGSENVGLRFAEEAVRMHRGETPLRKLHGEASPDQVRELVEEGVPVAPLPPEPRGN